MDQVGVKAPGSPTMTVLRPLVNSDKETILGGPKPSCRLTAGMRSPTLTMALSVARNMNLWPIPRRSRSISFVPSPSDWQMRDGGGTTLPATANETVDDGPSCYRGGAAVVSVWFIL